MIFNTNFNIDMTGMKNMKHNDITPRTDQAIQAAKRKNLIFLVTPSLLFFICGILTFIGTQGAPVEVIGFTVSSLAGTAFIVAAGLFVVPAYLLLARYAEISYEEFMDLKRTTGQPRPVNQYIREMKKLRRTKIVRDDLVRLKRLCKFYRQGATASAG